MGDIFDFVVELLPRWAVAVLLSALGIGAALLGHGLVGRYESAEAACSSSVGKFAQAFSSQVQSNCTSVGLITRVGKWAQPGGVAAIFVGIILLGLFLRRSPGSALGDAKPDEDWCMSTAQATWVTLGLIVVALSAINVVHDSWETSLSPTSRQNLRRLDATPNSSSTAAVRQADPLLAAQFGMSSFSSANVVAQGCNGTVEGKGPDGDWTSCAFTITVGGPATIPGSAWRIRTLSSPSEPRHAFHPEDIGPCNAQEGGSCVVQMGFPVPLADQEQDRWVAIVVAEDDDPANLKIVLHY